MSASTLAMPTLRDLIYICNTATSNTSKRTRLMRSWMMIVITDDLLYELDTRSEEA